MNGGSKFLACSAMMVVAACGGESGKLEIRAMPTPLAQGKKPVSFRVAEGHQQMALHNVALALESYRNALREDPNSIDALAGMGAAYDRMGRYDLAGRNYEAALAIEPGNTTILAMLAASLDQQGKPAAALAVRLEIKQRVAAAAAPVPVQVAEMAARGPAAPVAPAPPPPVAAPAAAAPVAIAEAPLPAPDLNAALPTITSAPLAVALGTIAPAAVAAAFAPDEPAKVSAAPAAPAPTQLAQASQPARSVTIKLPAARAVAAPVIAKPTPAVSPATSVKLAEVAPPKLPPAPAPAPAKPQPAAPVAAPPVALAMSPKATRPPAALPVATGRGPRLERTSLGEVALISVRQSRWASLVVKQDRRSATVRFVPLRDASARFASVKLLNAARIQGLAAKTRSTLFDRGWRGMAIGDAAAIRARSLVLYPAHRRTTALSLARQFGFETAQRASGKDITVLLGRDAALHLRRSPAG